jgi:hypothetical protein
MPCARSAATTRGGNHRSISSAMFGIGAGKLRNVSITRATVSTDPADRSLNTSARSARWWLAAYEIKARRMRPSAARADAPGALRSPK